MALKDRTAIITGSSKGIGAAIAIELAKQGCNTVINYNSDREGAREVLRKIRNGTGADAIMVTADVGRYKDVKKLIGKAVDSFKKIDILVNNAGIAIWKPFLEITEEMWNRTMDTNLKGTFMCSQIAAREMIKTGGGAIVNISSLGANGSMDCLIPYVTSKGGMTLLTKALAVELAPYN
ncbi:MAG: SDR family NAD(P)-dependent oxidoreductase, partial [Actinomycetota bacterium]